MINDKLKSQKPSTKFRLSANSFMGELDKYDPIKKIFVAVYLVAQQYLLMILSSHCLSLQINPTKYGKQ